MIWVAIGTLAAISFGLKAVGPVLVGDRELDRRVAVVVALLPVPMLAALVVVGTLATATRSTSMRACRPSASPPSASRGGCRSWS